MSELPPDPPRLRAILAHLEQQIADNATIGIYLRLQHDAVRKALTGAERQQTQARQKPDDRRPGAPTGTGDGYMLEQKRHPKDPRPGHLHVDDCTMANQKTSPITQDQLRVALRDTEHIEPCGFCRPQDKLKADE